ncbi:hypothetical protein B0H19DRAFT_1183708 [Mycena capillaripes]|nr:hypothetical protein B0H19DRAFT_1183708 [Mycena capillaripes]
MRTLNASLFLFTALTFTHAAALPTGNHRRQDGSPSASASASSSDFQCPPTDTDGVSLSGNFINGLHITCSYDTILDTITCNYALQNGGLINEQDGSTPPPSCPPDADSRDGSSSASATSTASASASSSSISSSFDFHCPSVDKDGVSLSGDSIDGFNLTCSYDTSLGPRDCPYALQNGGLISDQDGSTPPPSCPPHADPRDGSSSASAISTVKASASSSASATSTARASASSSASTTSASGGSGSSGGGSSKGNSGMSFQPSMSVVGALGILAITVHFL